MRLTIRGEYPADWPTIARRVKDDAGWRCVRCRHPFYRPADAPYVHGAAPCDALCDAARCPVQTRGRFEGLSFTVHHLDGDKANCAWWNLLATCNACHLTVQARVIPERAWLLDHSPWFVPFVCGFYAHYYGGLAITRGQAEADPERWLELGQPWRTEAV